MGLEVSVQKVGDLSILKLTKDHIQFTESEDMIAFIKKANLQGKNVIDGGSNIGLISLLLSTEVGGSGLVYGFELQRLIFQIGCGNVVLNGRSNVISFNAALSNISGNMVGFSTIDYSEEKVSSTGIRTEPTFGKIDYYDRVKTIALDDLNIQNVGLIKLDLEGHEPEALDGMWATIDKWKPYLVIELSNGYLGVQKVREMVSLIESHGYSITEGESFNYFAEPVYLK